MEPWSSGGSPCPHHHCHPICGHHHHHRHVHACPKHGHHHQHVHACSNHRHHHHHHLLPHPRGLAPFPSQNHVTNSEETEPSGAQVSGLGIENANEEDDDDPVFVLTDEWREFFAKSEAKIKLEKQLAKRKGNK